MGSMHGKVSKAQIDLKHEGTEVFKAWIQVRHTRSIWYTRHVRHAMSFTTLWNYLLTKKYTADMSEVKY